MKNLKRLTALLLLICLTTMSIPGKVNAYSYMTSRDNISTSEVLAGISKQTFSSSMTADRAVDYITHFIGNTATYRKVPNGSGAQKTGTDGTYSTTLKWGSTGCYHYADFVNTTMYGQGDETRFLTQSGGVTAADVKSFLQLYGQAGEHIRLDGHHSLVYISSTETGFYTLQYYGNGIDPFLSFASYAYFAGLLNETGKPFWISESDSALNNGQGLPGGTDPVGLDPADSMPPSTGGGNGAGAFIDVAVGDDFFAEIEMLYSRGIVRGYGDGYYGVNDSLKRWQAAKMVTLGSGLAYAGKTANFPDVAAGTEMSPYVAALTEIGAIRGYADGAFGPNAYITRAQIAQIVVMAFGLTYGPYDVTFTDLPAGDAGMYIRILASHGIVSGYDGLYKPNESATRGQFAKILSRAMEVTGRR